MADFPDKVNTQTSSGTRSNAHGSRLYPIGIDTYFLKSFLGILMTVELVFGMLVWALIAGSRIWKGDEAFGWVMFVAILLWILTIILFLFYLLNLTSKLPMVPWRHVRLYFNLGATILYLTAFITNASSVDPTSIQGTYRYNNRAASAISSTPVGKLLDIRCSTVNEKDQEKCACHCEADARWRQISAESQI
ncbi:plasmolipin-like isoform X1 [Pristis pectinata]|uniref:plasmolipin-like isoform X1 n=1 Tax=Pristis pectinata TaxID=685728 RepID=UPI00223E2895|nr:plasmolipin-like isoform X1 [Pristis pectinata]